MIRLQFPSTMKALDAEIRYRQKGYHVTAQHIGKRWLIVAFAVPSTLSTMAG